MGMNPEGKRPNVRGRRGGANYRLRDGRQKPVSMYSLFLRILQSSYSLSTMTPTRSRLIYTITLIRREHVQTTRHRLCALKSNQGMIM